MNSKLGIHEPHFTCPPFRAYNLLLSLWVGPFYMEFA